MFKAASAASAALGDEMGGKVGEIRPSVFVVFLPPSALHHSAFEQNAMIMSDNTPKAPKRSNEKISYIANINIHTSNTALLVNAEGNNKLYNSHAVRSFAINGDVLSGNEATDVLMGLQVA